MPDLDDLEAKAKAAITPMSSGFAGMLSDAAIEFIASANPDSILYLIRELRETRAAVAAEREACADLIQGWNTAMTDKLAAEIRARGAERGEKC